MSGHRRVLGATIEVLRRTQYFRNPVSVECELLLSQYCRHTDWPVAPETTVMLGPKYVGRTVVFNQHATLEMAFVTVRRSRRDGWCTAFRCDKQRLLRFCICLSLAGAIAISNTRVGLDDVVPVLEPGASDNVDMLVADYTRADVRRALVELFPYAAGQYGRQNNLVHDAPRHFSTPCDVVMSASAAH